MVCLRQSPLCVEVERLIKSGVVVVVAAGNTGYGYVQAQGKPTAATAGLDLTINDPGNADLAITVGSTHRDMPHIYGVSYFSSKGPTGDGRMKPDLVAPGERLFHATLISAGLISSRKLLLPKQSQPYYHNLIRQMKNLSSVRLSIGKIVVPAWLRRMYRVS
jgi:hypothetical protein